MRAFADLIRARQSELWSAITQSGHPQVCEHELRTRFDDFAHWKCCPQWHRKLSHKLNAKEFAAKCGVRVANLYWYGTDPAAIPFDTLPTSYVIKLSNGANSEQVIPVRNGTFDVLKERHISHTTIEQTLNEMRGVVADPNAGIIVEEFIGSAEEGLPHDYKFFCFHGVAKVLYVCDRHRNTLTWYDRDWNLIRDPMHTMRNFGPTEERPINLEAMLETAELLARSYEFPFVRIDIYCPQDVGPTFGEFTHTPFGDSLDFFTPFANKWLGQFWERSGI
ncbi:ATP-grasp fold amidoligase family protein [Solimicrobium silvestre]|uniref:TupA-like ATPgrasp n=1 Tax=Solimicrobium silvestre TaxID=2099400 RepID=A0A2S9H2Z3_9BURK|nr:ATP-grasp fold amidoligase family protein [Solimicrobium silvestre]PRC94352.1 TupA-like ATPgrasp [Solimicrobium silvestre]